MSKKIISVIGSSGNIGNELVNLLSDFLSALTPLFIIFLNVL